MDKVPPKGSIDYPAVIKQYNKALADLKAGKVDTWISVSDDLKTELAALKKLIKEMAEMLDNELEYGYQMPRWEALKNHPKIKTIVEGKDDNTT